MTRFTAAVFVLALIGAGCRTIGVAPVVTAGAAPSSAPYNSAGPVTDLGNTSGNAVSLEILWFNIAPFDDPHREALREALRPKNAQVLSQMTWSEYTVDLVLVKGSWYTVRGRAIGLPKKPTQGGAK